MKPIPRITTRGYYDLDSGKTLKKNKYYFYPKNDFAKLGSQKEIVIMIHGLRNDKSGALKKFEIAKKRLKQIGYRYPVIGYSYDSNAKGAHLKKSELHALHVGQKIAQKNGHNLSEFILDFKSQNPQIKIRLMGHSLGSQVIMSTLEHLYKKKKQKGLIESVYFFGASVLDDTPVKSKKIIQDMIKTKLVNYYSPWDEVLKYAHEHDAVKNPIGLYGAKKNSTTKYLQRKVRPQNHRFASYAKVLNSFP